MAARPRKYTINVENLYQKTDKRNGKTYYNYKHPETGTWIGLGTDREKAFAAAKEANLVFAERRLDMLHLIIDSNPKATAIVGISVKQWIERYIKIQYERMADGKLKPETVRTKVYRAELMTRFMGSKGIREVTTKDIFDVLEQYKEKNKMGMARNIQVAWRDVFIEAQYAGEVESGFNPVTATRKVQVTTKRKRLTTNDVDVLFNSKIFKSRKYINLATKIAITTALRRVDIVNLKFSDVKNGFLFVSLSKSNGNTKLAFPLELTNPYLNQSLGDIIKECRGTRIVSKHLIHHTRNKTGRYTVSKGQFVEAATITTTFYEAKTECKDLLSDFSVSFHELRSFAERTYREVGVDTKVLLGHKNQETTDTYNDDRSDQYTFIQLPSNM
ncbi:MAG: phage integrase Arm DNA-binding domain-containing protein [Vibrio sp.]